MANAYPLTRTVPVASLSVDSRATFINRTYQHLLGAILAFAALEVFLFTSGIAERMAQAMLGVNWLWVLGGFLIVSWFATVCVLPAAASFLRQPEPVPAP